LVLQKGAGVLARSEVNVVNILSYSTDIALACRTNERSPRANTLSYSSCRGL
jgi:hypothetical protein